MRLGELGLGLSLGGHAGGLGLQVGGVVALVGEELPAVHLADPLGGVVEEVAVVGDGEHGARVGLQVLFEPEHRFGVQVVGGLVEEQQVGLLQKQAAQRHATALAAGKDAHGRVRVGALQRVHGLGELGVEVPPVGGVDLVLQFAHLVHERVEVGVGRGHLLADLVEALHLGQHIGEGHLNVLEDGLVLFKRRLLQKNAHGVAGRQARLAVGNLLEAGHDLQQGGLAHAVGPHDADLRAGVERQRNVVQNNLVAHRLAGLVHLVDELCHDAPVPSARFLGSQREARTGRPSAPSEPSNAWAVFSQK